MTRRCNRGVSPPHRQPCCHLPMNRPLTCPLRTTLFVRLCAANLTSRGMSGQAHTLSKLFAGEPSKSDRDQSRVQRHDSGKYLGVGCWWKSSSCPRMRELLMAMLMVTLMACETSLLGITPDAPYEVLLRLISRGLHRRQSLVTAVSVFHRWSEKLSMNHIPTGTSSRACRCAWLHVSR